MAVERDDRIFELAALADSAAAECDWEHQILLAIVSDHGDDADHQRLADAFRFHARRSANNGERFGPMLTFENGESVPAPLMEVPDETCALWEEVLTISRHPRIRARLADLLFLRRSGNIGSHLATAAAAYIEDGTSTDPPTMHSVDALCRAYALARAGRQDDLVARATSELLRSASASIDAAEPKPGVALSLIEDLIDAGCSDPAVDDLLDRARDRYPDMWITERTIEMQRRHASDGAARRDLDRQLIERVLEEAENVDPLVAVIHREKAATLARERGLPDLAERAVVAMQSADPLELPRISVEVESSVTPEQVEELIASMAGDTWWESVQTILSYGPPSGDVSRNRKTAEEVGSRGLTSLLLPKKRLGGDGLPRYQAQTDEERADDELADVETMALQMHGPLVTEALRRAGATFRPTPKEVRDSLESVG